MIYLQSQNIIGPLILFIELKQIKTFDLLDCKMHQYNSNNFIFIQHNNAYIVKPFIIHIALKI